MEKPIQLIIEDVKNDIINFLNKECSENKLDFYFLESILKEIYQETIVQKDNELEELKKEYVKNEKESGDK